MSITEPIKLRRQYHNIVAERTLYFVLNRHIVIFHRLYGGFSRIQSVIYFCLKTFATLFWPFLL